MKLAQDFEKIEGELGLNYDSSSKIGDIVTDIIPYIIGAAGIVLLLSLIMGGIGLMTSGGDPKKTEASKQKITNSLIGIIIVFASFWIVQIVGSILGVETFKGLISF